MTEVARTMAANANPAGNRHAFAEMEAVREMLTAHFIPPLPV